MILIMYCIFQKLEERSLKVSIIKEMRNEAMEMLYSDLNIIQCMHVLKH